MQLVEFKQGAKVDQVIETLSRQAAEASNGANWSSGHTPAEQLDHYYQWAETAEPQLINVLAAHAAQALVRTDTYWALRTASPDTVRINTLIRGEYESRQGALTELASQLKSEAKRWTDHAAPLLIPDTNMFVDKDEAIEQVDWAAVADRTVDVRLVVPLVVIHELDRLKRQGNSTTARSAQAAIRWLATVLPSDIAKRSGPLEVASPGATIEAYVHAGPTRPDDADGLIIEVCRWLGVSSNLPTSLVTKDLGMSLRGAAAGIEVIYLEKNPDVSSVARRT